MAYNSPMNKDITISCQDCGQEFAFTAGEQEFYASKNLPTPKYCLICRGKYGALERDAGKFGKKADNLREMRD